MGRLRRVQQMRQARHLQSQSQTSVVAGVGCRRGLHASQGLLDFVLRNGHARETEAVVELAGLQHLQRIVVGDEPSSDVAIERVLVGVARILVHAEGHRSLPP